MRCILGCSNSRPGSRHPMDVVMVTQALAPKVRKDVRPKRRWSFVRPCVYACCPIDERRRRRREVRLRSGGSGGGGFLRGRVWCIVARSTARLGLNVGLVPVRTCTSASTLRLSRFRFQYCHCVRRKGRGGICGTDSLHFEARIGRGGASGGYASMIGEKIELRKRAGGGGGCWCCFP